MKLIRNLHSREQLVACVATIGAFDGIHRGHQRLLELLEKQAKKFKLPRVLLTFEPAPREFFAVDKTSLVRLSNLREKIMLLQTKIDYLVSLRFDQRLAQVTAESFVTTVLCAQLGVKHLIVGEDFRFGYQRAGNVALLQHYALSCGFTVELASTVMDEHHQRISSSLIRKSLAVPDLDGARHALGRHYCFCGRVAQGDKRGRQLGVPTANILLKRYKSAVRGVFVVRVFITETQSEHYGVANIGSRPTVAGNKESLEVHLFAFNEDIYGYHLAVELLHFLREEKKFNSLLELQQQLQIDTHHAQYYLRQWC